VPVSQGARASPGHHRLSYFGWTFGLPPGEPGGEITGMLFGAGAGTLDWMPGSTPVGGWITPFVVPVCGKLPDSLAGGAITSGGVGENGGGGPGGAWVADGGLDGCAHAKAVLSATATTIATPMPPLRRLADLVSCLFIGRKRRRAPNGSPNPKK
jgi:hypothetical protein